MQSSNKKVLVIGASGLVGARFVALAKDDLEIIPIDENTLDITDKISVDNYFKNTDFDSVVNFAAITNVDGAQKERGNKDGITWKLNVVGVENIANASKLNNKFLVQISTDFVFSGDEKNTGPYSEDAILPDSDSGIGWYGWTKNRAENSVINIGPRNAIVRIAYPFYKSDFSQKLDFAKNYLKLYDEEKLFPIFTDQIFTPLNVDDLIEPMIKILNEELEGVFHVVSSDTATPFDFVEYLLKKARNVEGAAQKGSMVDFLKTEGRTPRPRLGGLKTEITQNKLGLNFKTWKEMVDEFVNEKN